MLGGAFFTCRRTWKILIHFGTGWCDGMDESESQVLI
jgi:hypothetical protein